MYSVISDNQALVNHKYKPNLSPDHIADSHILIVMMYGRLSSNGSYAMKIRIHDP